MGKVVTGGSEKVFDGIKAQEGRSTEFTVYYFSVLEMSAQSFGWIVMVLQL